MSGVKHVKSTSRTALRLQLQRAELEEQKRREQQQQQQSYSSGVPTSSQFMSTGKQLPTEVPSQILKVGSLTLLYYGAVISFCRTIREQHQAMCWFAFRCKPAYNIRRSTSSSKRRSDKSSRTSRARRRVVGATLAVCRCRRLRQQLPARCRRSTSSSRAR